MIMSSATTGIKWQIEAGKHLIGRGPHCALVADYDTVSREHAELDISADGKIMLIDKGSRNGTYVNDRLLDRPIELRAGLQCARNSFSHGKTLAGKDITCAWQRFQQLDLSIDSTGAQFSSGL